MGYRHKLGIMKKSFHEKIKDLSLDELEKKYSEDDFLACYHLTKEVHELGKYYEDYFLKKFRKPVFSDKEVEEFFQSDNDFYLIGKEGLEAIIKDYHSKIAQHFEDIVAKKFDGIRLGDTPEMYIRRKLEKWKNNYNINPYNLSLDSDVIVSDWSYEYSIFELVRIYKSIDYDKYHVTITAW